MGLSVNENTSIADFSVSFLETGLSLKGKGYLKNPKHLGSETPSIQMLITIHLCRPTNYIKQ